MKNFFNLSTIFLSMRKGNSLINSHSGLFYRSATGGSHVQMNGELSTKNEIKKASENHVMSVKPRSNKPFVKNFFLGIFDKAMLEFPEVLSKEELEELNHLTQPIEKFFLQKLDSKALDEQGKITDEIFKTLKELGLFGQQIPEAYGGLGLNATKYARLAEISSADGGISVTLAAHQAIGLKGILIHGTEDQKEKYLPKLATGEHIAAFCLTEPSSGSDAASIHTRAVQSEDGKTFYLTGNKIWISNGGIADIFTVFAKTEVDGPVGEKVDKVTAFIVERAFGGVTSGKPEDKLGIRCSNTCAVHFDNTPVPAENILGDVGDGFKVAVNILNSGRFSMGSSVAGEMKRIMALAAEHAITRSQFGKKLKEFGLIQKKFAEMALATYAMESMSYVTAAIMDQNELPDASVEAAIVKVFSSEAAWNMISECMQIFGGLGYMKDYPFERILRDARILLIFEGTNEILRLFIALSGLQWAGAELMDTVRKFKDPLNNVGFLVSKSMERLWMNPSSPKLKHKLYNDVHPVLGPTAEDLEKRLVQFSLAVEDQLSLYRDNIVNEQMALERLADIAIDLYAMSCVIARASRSKAIGLKSHDHEILLAQTFCFKASNRIERRLLELDQKKVVNGDEAYRIIAEDICKAHGYAAEHPLTRNW